MAANKQKILVGMSGGVDSSLAAALLVEAGHNVTGVFLKVWSEEEFVGLDSKRSSFTSQESFDCAQDTSEVPPSRDPINYQLSTINSTGCPWEQDLADAQAVADQLGIELIVRNVQKEYWDRVVATFIDGYRQGVTPNPDILCNSEIKFGILYDWALANNFDFVATGHYARVVTRENDQITSSNFQTTSKSQTRNPHYQLPTMNYELHRGADAKKDQTYFLWKIDQEKFEHILFPIGHLTKDRVRVEATKRGLVTAAKKDSQGICFLGKVNVREWLSQELKTVPGDVVTVDGTIVGRHKGAQLYTLGQRDGLGVSGGTGLPFYVVARDLAANRLVVAHERPQGRELTATELNWLGPVPSVGDRIEARIRHGQQPQPAEIIHSSFTSQESAHSANTSEVSPSSRSSPIINHQSPIVVRFSEPQTAIAPGQSVVFSIGTHILGGGIIA